MLTFLALVAWFFMMTTFLSFALMEFFELIFHLIMNFFLTPWTIRHRKWLSTIVWDCFILDSLIAESVSEISNIAKIISIMVIVSNSNWSIWKLEVMVWSGMDSWKILLSEENHYKSENHNDLHEK